jgi:membrane fusion protein, multidrug efflux system
MNGTTAKLSERGPATVQPAAALEAKTKTASGNQFADVEPARSPRRAPRRWLSASATTVLLIAALIGGVQWWRANRAWARTDNAYVAGHIHTVSSRVIGTVSEVLVAENQSVAAGAVLARLDRRDLEVQRQQAQAALAQAEAQQDQARAEVIRLEALTTRAQLEFARTEELYHAQTSSKQEFDNAKASLDAARAAVNAARAAVASVAAAKLAAVASLTNTELQLSYTEIVAPAAGRIGKKNVEVGNRVAAGQALLAVVSPEVWVVANFKETQLAHMQPGQAATLSIDSVPGRTFAGRVESLSPASGAQFALLPPDNATGNFTKIVQRVPVKIVFDAESLRGVEDRLGPGMSAVVRVKVL